MADLEKAIGLLSEKLGMAADMIYPLLVRQMRIDTLWDIFWIALSGVAIFWIWRWFKWVARTDLSNEYGAVVLHYAGIVIGMFVVIGIIMTCAYEIGNILLNPELYALNSLINKFK
jgi:hypothetical protein